jgi:hypothetical protein
MPNETTALLHNVKTIEQVIVQNNCHFFDAPHDKETKEMSFALFITQDPQKRLFKKYIR